MVYIVTNKRGISSTVIAHDVRAARRQSTVSNAKGKKSDLRVEHINCQQDNHLLRYDDRRGYFRQVGPEAVTLVKGIATCAVCCSVIGGALTIEERLDALERRLKYVEDNTGWAL